jgi:hypothetical protein
MYPAPPHKKYDVEEGFLQFLGARDCEREREKKRETD